MALGEKRIETRSWQTPYRGLVAIAASAKWQPGDVYFALGEPACIEVWKRHGVSKMAELPLGEILCVGLLTDCVKTEYFDTRRRECGEFEDAFGNYASGRYAWVFESIRRLTEPIKVKGSLGLYALPEDALGKLRTLQLTEGRSDLRASDTLFERSRG